MATDVMLLEKFMVDSEISIALRFYTWEGVWLSIGKNQKYLPESTELLLGVQLGAGTKALVNKAPSLAIRSKLGVSMR